MIRKLEPLLVVLAIAIAIWWVQREPAPAIAPSPTPTATAAATPEASGTWRDEKDLVLISYEIQEKEERERALRQVKSVLPAGVLTAQKEAREIASASGQYIVRDVRIAGDNYSRDYDIVLEPGKLNRLQNAWEQIGASRIRIEVERGVPTYEAFGLLSRGDVVSLEYHTIPDEEVESDYRALADIDNSRWIYTRVPTYLFPREIVHLD
ncbi:hypothetical protein HY375_00430 [Candidatus Berkelbacteria bacterium]|nr:hypothetical protein [Candidatus Berkelbacteria bacterium]